MRMGLRACLLFLAASVAFHPAAAATAAPAWVPQDLRDWVPWVTRGSEYRECPFLLGTRAQADSDFRCAWPGTLRLEVDGRGARFEQSWAVTATEQWVPLPGDAEHWPAVVEVDGRSAAVFEHDARPALRLAPGRYRVGGRFDWQGRPRTLAIPGETGLLALTVDGESVPQPRRDDGTLFLARDEGASPREDALGVQVYRLVEDAVPTRLTTRLQLEAAGRVREVTLGPVLPAGFVPQSLAAPMPARLDPDGTLTLQIRPGRWTVELVGRADTLVEQVPRPSAGSAWPGTEIWSYRADERLRIAVPVGMTTVDPAQAGVPAPWGALPAFAIAGGDAFTLEQRRRGGLPGDNALTVERQLWLDFDGEGFTALDQVRGTMQRDWRLNLGPPWELLGARDGRDDALLVTHTPDGDARGVEWRERDVSLQALSRLPGAAGVPITGWSQRLTSLNATIHLPPGYRLGAAIGADSAPGAWLSRWRLLDLFVVLLAAAAAGKLYGRAAGAVALVTLVLIHQDLPVFSWLLLNLLAAVALARAAPEGRLRQLARWYRHGSMAALALLFVPFAVNQIRYTLYPQLEASAAYAPARLPTAAPAQAMMEMKRAAESRAAADALRASGQAIDQVAAGQPPVATPPRPAAEQRYAPGARVQTGPGIPEWRWNTYPLRWSGPVEPGQTMRLVILPRWAVALWRVLMLGLGLAVLWWLGRDTIEALRKLRLPVGGNAGAALPLAMLSVMLAASMPGDLRAETPSPALLEELRQRLLAAPECVPDCAVIDTAGVVATGDRLEILLVINALEAVAVPVPGAEQGWLPGSVTVDGQSPGRVLRHPDGTLWLAVEAGAHRIALGGRLPDAERVEIAFPLVPKRLSVQASGWTVAGLRGERLVADALELRRDRPAEEAAEPALEGGRFPDYLRVARTVTLGLDWSVTTRVTRVAPAEGAINAQIPLLPGESVVSDGIAVEGRRVQVALGSGQDGLVWRSSLARSESLTLRAPADAPWSERWQFRVGSPWHATLDGVPVYETGDHVWQPVFLPLPGEALTVEISRPDAVDGALLAVDRVSMHTRYGARSAETTLEFDYRSSLGGPHVITLPEGAEVTRLQQDGSELPVPGPGDAVRIPTLPGSHAVQMSWRQDVAMDRRAEIPAVDLAAPVSNISVSAEMPRNRWLLGTSGPIVGPAVLYWPALAALVLVAAALGRTRLTPLRTRHWFLLGLGFSTFAWPTYALVAGWLLAMGWRDRWPEDVADNEFRAKQAAVGVLSVAALAAIVLSIPIGLLGTPDMHIMGNGSFGYQMNWFQDRSEGVLPAAGIFSLPLWIYKVAILLWALWLAFALIRWLPWAWRAFSRGGIWRGRVKT